MGFKFVGYFDSEAISSGFLIPVYSYGKDFYEHTLDKNLGNIRFSKINIKEFKDKFIAATSDSEIVIVFKVDNIVKCGHPIEVFNSVYESILKGEIISETFIESFNDLFREFINKPNKKLIAHFMGYTYFEPDVLVDYSLCGGIYDKVDVYSKVPIEIRDYGDEERYFAYDWDVLNSGQFLTEPTYHSCWNSIMEVLDKISKLDLKEFCYEWDSHNGKENNFQSVTFEIDNNSCYIYVNLTLDPPIVFYSTGDDVKKCTVEAIVKFIHWINYRRENA